MERASQSIRFRGPAGLSLVSRWQTSHRLWPCEQLAVHAYSALPPSSAPNVNVPLPLPLPLPLCKTAKPKEVWVMCFNAAIGGWGVGGGWKDGRDSWVKVRGGHSGWVWRRGKIFGGREGIHTRKTPTAQ